MVKTVIHKLILAGILLSGLTSCVKSEIRDGGMSDVPMLFSIYASRSTNGIKADNSYVAPGITVLPTGSSFGVMAYYQPGTIDSYTGVWADLATKLWKPDFMFNEEVTYDGANYNYSPLRYWPANYENTISFWAYYPYSVYATDNSGVMKLYSNDACTVGYDSSSTGLPRVKYTVPANTNDQPDLLFDSFENRDMTYTNCDPVDGTVDLNFKHALSLVRFNFGALPEGVSVTVTDMTIRNLYMSGTLTNLTPATAGAYDWTVTGDRGTSTCSVTDITSSSAAFILMPQSLVNNVDASLEPYLDITFNMTIAAADGSDPIQYSSNTGTAKLKYIDDVNHANDILAFAPGKSYLYTISVTLDTIEFSEAVESPAWDITINTDL